MGNKSLDEQGSSSSSSSVFPTPTPMPPTSPLIKLAGDTARNQYYDVYNALYFVGKVLSLEIEGKQRPICSIFDNCVEIRASIVKFEELFNHPFMLVRDCLMEVVLTPDQLAELARQSRDPETLAKFQELLQQGEQEREREGGLNLENV